MDFNEIEGEVLNWIHLSSHSGLCIGGLGEGHKARAPFCRFIYLFLETFIF
jgi:hypothetical protein